MVGPGAIQFVPVSFSDTVDSLAALFRGGQTQRGLVVRGGESLLLQIAGARVPLPKNAGAFEAGQRVLVTLSESPAGATLRISPQPASTSSAPAAPAAPSLLLSSVLESLGALSQKNLSAAARILPAQVALPEEAMRALLSLFVSRRETGRSLATVSNLLQEAIASGAISRGAAQLIKDLAARMKTSDAASFREALRAIREITSKPVEARLAALMRSGGEDALESALRDSLYAQLARLRTDRGLTEFLRASGKLAAFEAAVDGLVEQIRGNDLQQLRAPEISYHFVEMPLHPESEITRAQVHFFEDEDADDREGGSESSLVVLDLSLSRLGDLWVTLRVVENVCVCRIEATDPVVAAQIGEHAHELAGALRDAGYSDAVVEAEVLEGDRIDAVARLFGGLSGLDISA